MAIAGELTQRYAALEEAAKNAGHVRLAVHDASRLEWSLSVPLSSDKPIDYSLSVEIQIPQNAYVRHSPWDQIQAFTRLDGPAALGPRGDAQTIDSLRRGALAMAGQLARAFDGFSRHCRLAGSLFAMHSHSEIEDALTIWIEAAVRIAEEARAKLAPTRDDEAVEVARERALVDEYISVRLLEALAGAERALSGVAGSKAPHAQKLAPVIAAVEARLAVVLAAELGYRQAHGMTVADPTSPQALERYLERSSRLKKHFQEVLFLESESFRIADRAYHWVAGFCALVASTWAFAWQIALISRATTATTVTSSLVTACVLGGLVYAGKDRIKEIGRNWMTRKMRHLWGAERITRYRAPARRLPARDIVVTARESFEQRESSLPDPLNPEAGATQNIAVLTYEQSGTVIPQPKLAEGGVQRVKHVFRYDLSPIFARLDDATKPVPVLDETSKKVRFIDAPRCYRVPIRVEVTCGSAPKYVETATLVLHKRGLERLERDSDSNPSLSEIGIEPG
ncbi:MAG TPA: hypothetical protein VIF62_03875 [Labilithrix sp.]